MLVPSILAVVERKNFKILSASLGARSLDDCNCNAARTLQGFGAAILLPNSDGFGPKSPGVDREIRIPSDLAGLPFRSEH